MYMYMYVVWDTVLHEYHLQSVESIDVKEFMSIVRFLFTKLNLQCRHFFEKNWFERDVKDCNFFRPVQTAVFFTFDIYLARLYKFTS